MLGCCGSAVRALRGSNYRTAEEKITKLKNMLKDQLHDDRLLWLNALTLAGRKQNGKQAKEGAQTTILQPHISPYFLPGKAAAMSRLPFPRLFQLSLGTTLEKHGKGLEKPVG